MQAGGGGGGNTHGGGSNGSWYVHGGAGGGGAGGLFRSNTRSCRNTKLEVAVVVVAGWLLAKHNRTGAGGSGGSGIVIIKYTTLTMDAKIYRLYGIDTAMHLLRPGAKWEISNSVITKWDDPRPQPSMEEVREVMDKIQAFEDSINTVWLPEQIEELTGRK
jgi:hypothetical protein